MRQIVGRVPAPRPPSDDALAASRLAAPLLRIAEVDGLPALLVNPDGRAGAETTDAILAAFLARARDAQRDEILADADSSMAHGLTLARVARRWGMSEATLGRWRREAGRRVLAVRAGPSNEAGNARPSVSVGAEDSGSGGSADLPARRAS